MSRLVKPMSGRYGKWTVLREGSRTSKGIVKWWVRCDCGSESEVQGSALRNGKSTRCKSCWFKEANQIHGHASLGIYTAEYNSWRSMLQRVREASRGSNNKRFRCYIGIGVDERWLDFRNFLADMGWRPPGMTLDRKNPSLGYFPDNCRWADSSTQNLNRRPYRLPNGTLVEPGKKLLDLNGTQG